MEHFVITMYFGGVCVGGWMIEWWFDIRFDEVDVMISFLPWKAIKRIPICICIICDSFLPIAWKEAYSKPLRSNGTDKPRRGYCRNRRPALASMSLDDPANQRVVGVEADRSNGSVVVGRWNRTRGRGLETCLARRVSSTILHGARGVPAGHKETSHLCGLQVNVLFARKQWGTWSRECWFGWEELKYKYDWASEGPIPPGMTFVVDWALKIIDMCLSTSSLSGELAMLDGKWDVQEFKQDRI